ncbi:oxygen-independent coproporphyrinogen III oxidase [Marinihelvus fidelis]|uniref:oxygen-independent coproporphyrinogen III oxidase n=1 Tax=Marinihelvus fidelis TaxID=2613842 RepID=UPI001CD4F661|nr:oxygen-independent coproporphyrinogen III oxidase [Marinihelvus fidelis]
MRSGAFDAERPVNQIHFGGGTPTFLDDGQLARLMDTLSSHFSFRDDDGGDYAIEIDPRTVDRKRLVTLRSLGFNRISLGVQDLNPLVQKAVNRVQPYEMIRDTIAWAREIGFHSINVDLICGLPLQTETSLLHSLDRLLPLKPDRISMYNYAHLPARFKVQRQIDESALPPAAEKIRMVSRGGSLLQDHGYRFIGMDHFALEDDEMARAQRDGKLHRNFQGYTLHGDTDLVGLGVSAISDIGDLYLQNEKGLDQWKARLHDDQLPIWKGYRLERDDMIRRDLIMRLLCDLELDIGAFESRWKLDFDDYFADALPAWRNFDREGLADREGRRLKITDQGRLVSRALVQVFDAHIQATEPAKYSRVL